MQEMLLINPRRRKRRGGKRKMSALQRQYFGGGRRHKRRRKRSAPLLFSNPRRRSRRRHVMRLRRNPSLRSATSNLMSGMVPAMVGAAGALGVDWALANFGANLPASFMQGPLYPVTRIAACIGLGMLAGALVNKRVGSQVAAGALTVVVYDTAKQYLVANVPSLGLQRYVGMGRVGRFGRYVGRMNGLGRLGYIGPGVNAGPTPAFRPA